MSYPEKTLYVDSTAYNAVPMWTAATAYTVGQIVRQRAAPTVGNERCFVCTLAGTSLATEPAWATISTKGSITTEVGGPKWQESIAHPALNGDPASVSVWLPNQINVFLGVIIKNVAGTHYFINTTNGNQFSVTAEPAWNFTLGATTVESSITWLCLGPISNFTARWAAPAPRLSVIWNNSTSWTINNNMITFVGDDHAETLASGTMNIMPSGSIIGSVVCVDHTAPFPLTPADLRATATFTLTGTAALVMFSQSATYAYGLQFINAGTGGFDIGSGTLCQARLDTCTFSLTNTNTGLKIRISLVGSLNGTQFEFKDCTFNLAASGQMIHLDMANIKMENCAFTGVLAGANQALFTGGSRLSNTVIEGSDLSGLATGGTLVARSVSGYILFKDCKLPANFTGVFVSGDSNMFPGLVIDLVRCASDGTNYRNERHTSGGAETISTKLARSGGAVDGVTAISHQLAINSTILNPYTVFNGWPLVIWNDLINVDRFVTLYGIANDLRVPTNDEVFMVAEYLGSASSPKGSFKRGSKGSILSAAGPLSADTSAWDLQVPAVARSTAYVVGDVIKHASNPGRVFFCTGAGTTGASLPADGLVTWSGLDSNANVNTSGDGLTITQIGSGTGYIRTTGAQTASKFYFEHKNMHIEQYLGYSVGVVGIITGSGVFSNYSSVGCTIDFQGTVWSCGTRYLSVLPGYPSMAPGVTWCCAVDLVNKKFWVRYDNGPWNGNAANDPANNIGGIDISALFPTNAAFGFAALTGSGNANTLLQYTTNFGLLPFGFPVPAGFSAGPYSQGYSTAIDGSVVGDGTATFRAGCRFSQTLTLNSPQPQQKGYLYAYPKIGRAGVPYFIDPKLRLS